MSKQMERLDQERRDQERMATAMIMEAVVGVSKCIVGLLFYSS
jgi:hypothetical protein